MSISPERAIRHIQEQTTRLTRSRQRSFWPNFLYHTTHVTNAVQIVHSNVLQARNNITTTFHDVANQGALGANQSSHNFARLYFRPRNPYHLRTEGIKCLSHPNRLENQASIPITFIFDFKSVMTLDGVRFTKGNIQRGRNSELQGDAAFDTLDFNATYHDDWVTPQEKDYIHDCRMAEVMVPSALPLLPHLKAICFRTRWDLETFRHLLAQVNGTCPWRVQVEQITNSLYMHQGLYIIELDFLGDELRIRFHLPVDYRPNEGSYKVRVGQFLAGTRRRSFDKSINLQSGSLLIKGFLPDNQAIWIIELEEVLAFQGQLAHAQSQVFG